MITVGVLTPHATAGPESEFPLMAPAQVATTVVRLRPPVASGAAGGEPPTSPSGLRASATPAVLDEAASSLLPDSVDVLVLASTSTGYAMGHDAESALLAQLCDRWERPVYAPSQSAVAALQSRRIERVSLVHPPWLGPSLNRLGADYFRSQGFDVVDAHRADLPRDPDEIEPALVVEWVTQHTSDRAEAVVIGGNGFRAARAIHALEDRLGRLVLEANQVLLWSILEGTHASVEIHGFGGLFDGPLVE